MKPALCLLVTGLLSLSPRVVAADDSGEDFHNFSFGPMKTTRAGYTDGYTFQYAVGNFDLGKGFGAEMGAGFQGGYNTAGKGDWSFYDLHFSALEGIRLGSRATLYGGIGIALFHLRDTPRGSLASDESVGLTPVLQAGLQMQLSESIGFRVGYCNLTNVNQHEFSTVGAGIVIYGNDLF